MKSRPSSVVPEREPVLGKSREHARSKSIRHSELDSESRSSIVPVMPDLIRHLRSFKRAGERDPV